MDYKDLRIKLQVSHSRDCEFDTRMGCIAAPFRNSTFKLSYCVMKMHSRDFRKLESEPGLLCNLYECTRVAVFKAKRIKLF